MFQLLYKGKYKVYHNYLPDNYIQLFFILYDIDGELFARYLDDSSSDFVFVFVALSSSS